MGGKGWRGAAVFAIALVVAAIAACGGNDDGGSEEADTVTVTTGSAEPTETDAATTPSETTAPATGPQSYPGTDDQAGREIAVVIREFNRTANLGKLQDACNNYFSSAFLARLAGERQCANSIASARPAMRKIQVSQRFDSAPGADDGTATGFFAFGEASDPAGWRDIEMVYEDGAWKIDAVNVP